MTSLNQLRPAAMLQNILYQHMLFFSTGYKHNMVFLCFSTVKKLHTAPLRNRWSLKKQPQCLLSFTTDLSVSYLPRHLSLQYNLNIFISNMSYHYLSYVIHINFKALNACHKNTILSVFVFRKKSNSVHSAEQ